MMQATALCVLAAVLLSAAWAVRSAHHDPYMSTFLGRRSGKTLAELLDHTPKDIRDGRASASDAAPCFMIN